MYMIYSGSSDKGPSDKGTPLYTETFSFKNYLHLHSIDSNSEKWTTSLQGTKFNTAQCPEVPLYMYMYTVCIYMYIQ